MQVRLSPSPIFRLLTFLRPLCFRNVVGLPKMVPANTQLSLRIRKIRCDETAPVCRNCIKSNRRCDGVAQPVGGPGNVTFTAPLTLTYFRPTQTGWLSQDEIAYLDLFRHELIYTIVGDSHSPAWKRMILQAVHEEVALCHAVVAFSSLTSHIRSRPSSPSSSGSPPPGMDNEFALRHYGKALESMRHVVHHNDSRSINTALICTLLCICFELRMRDIAVALTHLEHGLQVIAGNMDSGKTIIRPRRNLAS